MALFGLSALLHGFEPAMLIGPPEFDLAVKWLIRVLFALGALRLLKWAVLGLVSREAV
jgi:hypothetical protein